MNPNLNCDLCPRLAEFRETNRQKFPDWHNAPVPSFGDIDAGLLIVGLAPGLRGANRTSRPFTGDYAGQLLYPTLQKYGFARGTYDEEANDGLDLVGCRITNAVRCVPPQNKPVGAEINACRPFLIQEMDAMPNLQIVLCLVRFRILRSFVHSTFDNVTGPSATVPFTNYPMDCFWPTAIIVHATTRIPVG